MTGRGGIRRAVRWPAILLFGVLGGLVLVELALQAAALIVRWSDRRATDEPDVAGGRIVLCVGDSFTYGMGAGRDESYPARLQQRLRAAQPDSSWRVVVDAWPGRGSGEMVRLLPALLAEHRPVYLCALVGSADAWRLAAEPTAEDGALAGARRFLARLRLARLVLGRARADGGEAAEVADSPPPASVADWTLEDLERVPRDGRVDAVRMAAFGRIRAKLETARDSVGVLRLFRAANRDGVVRLVIDEGDWLNREFGPSAEVCRTMAMRVGRIQDPERGLQLARQAVVLDPGDLENQRVLAEAEWLWGTADRSIRALATAYAAGLEEERVERFMRRFGLAARLSPDEFLALLGDHPLDSARREALLGVLRRSGDQVAEAKVGVQHLERIVTMARDSGAVPVLLTYPGVGRGEPVIANEAIRDVATSRGVRLVDLAPLFAAKVAASSYDEWFGLDGHCTPKGYDLVAEQVAGAVLAE